MTLTKEYIQKLNKKDFEERPELYVSLVNIQDGLNRKTLTKVAFNRAVEVRAKTTFNANLKEAEKEKKEQKLKEIAENKCEIEERDMKFFTGPWTVDDNGVVGFTDKGRLEACPHPIIIERFSDNIQTGDEKITLAWKKGKLGKNNGSSGQWKTVEVEKNLIASYSKIVDVLAAKGIVITSESAKAMVKYLADIETYNINTNNIKRVISTSKLGWIKDTFVPYEGGIEIEAVDDFKNIVESIKPHGDYLTWLELVHDIRSTKRFEPRIYMAAALASLLIEKCGDLSFVVNLWGETGKGKTVALYLATSMFAKPEGEYISSSRSTNTALEIRSNFLNNFPVMIDDLSQMTNRFDGNYSDLIYQLCDGGRDRSNTKLTLNKKNYWKCAILTNSEKSIIDNTMTGGAINRIVDVKMDDGYIFDDGNGIVNTLRDNYGHLGPKFVNLIREIGWEKIIAIRDKYIEKIKARSEELNETKEEKQFKSMALILTADKLLEKHFFKDGILLDFDKCYEIIKSQDDIDENLRFYNEINEIATLRFFRNFIKRQGARGPKKFPESDDVWGVIDTRENTIAIPIEMFKSWCSERRTTKRVFLNWAEKNGCLVKDSWMVKLTDRSARCVILKLEDTNSELEEDGFVDQTESPFDK